MNLPVSTSRHIRPLKSIFIHSPLVSDLPCGLSASTRDCYSSISLTVLSYARSFPHIANFSIQPCGRKRHVPYAHISMCAHELHLIPFATLAFVFERQERTSALPSPLVFPMISTDFTPPP